MALTAPGRQYGLNFCFENERPLVSSAWASDGDQSKNNQDMTAAGCHGIFMRQVYGEQVGELLAVSPPAK